MNRSTPGLLVHHQFPEFTQAHICRVADAIQPSHPLSSPSPPAPNPSQHQGANLENFPNLENSAVAKDWKMSVFTAIPKKRSTKECSNYHTIALISHNSKVMLKILQVSLQQYEP